MATSKTDKLKKFYSGKVVLITGSSKGIGKATALLLGSMGAKICLNGRNAEDLTKVRDEFLTSGIDCISVSGDVSESVGCKKLTDSVVSHYGRMDILINNAGIASRGLVSELIPEAWQKVLEINTLGSIYPTLYALPHILETKGSIIFISSLAGKVGLPGHSAYSVSKMALSAFSHALQLEYNRSDLHTGIIYVGFTENESEKKILSPDGTYSVLKPRDDQKKASRQDVALSVAKTIYRRKNRITLSAVGKLQGIALRFFPFLLNLILRRSFRDYDKMY
ncbi:MAG: SDR family NAD(P)-dependent oxidoreductase [Bacteroidales bacterium]|nr:SDR family NAD(P)-dependent oxidoreductase [Bacteroidales bacterium]